MSERQVVAPPSPYKGLAAFEDSPVDALFFFGREKERAIVAANLLAYRLTVLYGASGVGKSSLLQAGVAHGLRREGEAVVVFRSWRGDPVTSVVDEVRETLRASFPDAVVDDSEDGLAASLAAWATALDRDLYLILDQLDEYFLYHGDDDGFAADLAEVATRTGLRANVLLSIRDDMLSQLDRFKALIPNLLSNYLRLDHLDRRSAREAIVGPLDRYNALVPSEERVTAEAELVEAVLDGSGSDGRIEAPYLQLVMQRLWEEEHRSGSRTLTLDTLERLGGAAEIVRAHLDDALESLSPRDRDLAAKLFNHLVTPSGTKIAHGIGDLAKYASVNEGEVAPVLAALVDERIVRPVTPRGQADGGQYEIFHDVLAEPVIAWRARHEAERELERTKEEARVRHRRLLIVSGLALLAVAIMAGVTVFALTQRQEARKQAKRAHVRALTGNARAALPFNPVLSLRSALQAAKSSPSPQTESVLRTVLLQEYERATLPGDGVRALAFSPDGRRGATAGTDGKVRLFSVPGGRLERTLSGSGAIGELAFDPAGRLVLAGGTPPIARIWKVDTGELVATLRHRKGAITEVGFTDDGKFAITAGTDGTARLWRPDGKRVRSFRHPGPVSEAVVNRQGDLLATVATDPNGHSFVRIFDARNRRLLHRLPELGMKVVAFSPNGRILATGSADDTARLWNARTGKQLHGPLEQHGDVFDVAFSPDGSLLATAGQDGGTWVWEVATGTRYLVITGTTNPTYSVDFSRDGRFLVSSSRDGSARVFALGNLEGTVVARLVGHDGGVISGAFSPDGLVGTVGEDETARLWDPGAEDQLRTLRTYSAPVTTVAVAHDGRLLVGEGREVLIGRNLAAMNVLRFPTHVTSAGFADHDRLVFVAFGNTVRVLRPQTGSVVAQIRARASVDGVAISPDASVIATSERGVGVRLRRTSDGSVAARVLEGQSTPAFSPDGQTLATGGKHGAVRLWDVAPTRLQHRPLLGHTALVTDIEFSPDGRRLASSSRDNYVIVWDARTGELRRRLVGSFGPVNAVSFSPDSRWVLGAAPESAVLWATSTGHLFYYLRGHTAAVTAAVFLPDGRRIVTSSADRTVRRYGCDICTGIDGLIRVAEQRLARLS